MKANGVEDVRQAGPTAEDRVGVDHGNGVRSGRDPDISRPGRGGLCLVGPNPTRPRRCRS